MKKRLLTILLTIIMIGSNIMVNSNDVEATILVAGKRSGFGKITMNEINGKNSYVHKTYTMSPHKGNSKKVDVTVDIFWDTDPKYKNIDYVEMALDNVVIDKESDVTVTQWFTEEFKAINTYSFTELKIPAASCTRSRSITYKRTAFSNRNSFSLNGDHYTVDDDMQHMYISMPLRSEGEDVYNDDSEWKYYRDYYKNNGKDISGDGGTEQLYRIERTYKHNRLTVKFTVKKKKNADAKVLDVRTTVHHMWVTSSNGYKAIVNGIGTAAGAASIVLSVASGDVVGIVLGSLSFAPNLWTSDTYGEKSMKQIESGNSNWARFTKTGLWT